MGSMNFGKIKKDNSRRKGFVPMDLTRKRTEAEVRAAERVERGDSGQLARLDAAFGPGNGAKKERTRLTLRLNSKVNAALAVVAKKQEKTQFASKAEERRYKESRKKA